jgi:hypothetical protein
VPPRNPASLTPAASLMGRVDASRTIPLSAEPRRQAYDHHSQHSHRYREMDMRMGWRRQVACPLAAARLSVQPHRLIERQKQQAEARHDAEAHQPLSSSPIHTAMTLHASAGFHYSGRWRGVRGSDAWATRAGRNVAEDVRRDRPVGGLVLLITDGLNRPDVPQQRTEPTSQPIHAASILGCTRRPQEPRGATRMISSSPRRSPRPLIGSQRGSHG